MYKNLSLLACLCLSLVQNAFAQYEPTMSSTGAEAADRRKAERDQTRTDYTMKIGKVELRMTGKLSQEYNDNIGLSETVTENDFITSPGLKLQAYWPITQLNSLDLSLDFGYAKYWDHPNLDSTSILLSPNSLLDFNIYVSDIHFNVHDRIAIQQDPAANPQLNNVATFRRLTNTAGIEAEWDLNKIIVSGGYDNDQFVSLENSFNSLDSTTHTLRAKAGVKASSQITTGLSTSYSMNEYDQNVQNGSDSYNIGTFADVIISEYLRGSVTVGFQDTTYDSGGTIADTTNFQSIVYSAMLQNQLNKWINHSLQMSRHTASGIGSNFTDIYEFNYNASADVVKNISTSLTLSYQLFEDSQSQTAEKGSRFTANPKASYQIFEATNVGLGYQFILKDSNLVGNDYKQNRVYLDVSHRF